MLQYAGETLRVFLVDDHDLVRRGLRDLLVPARDLQVVGDAGWARGAARSILDLETHVMVLDLHLQDGSGIEVCRAVRAEDPSVQGLLLTSAGDEEALLSTVLAGAAGYVVKLTNSHDLIGVVRRLGAGRALLDADTLNDARDRLREQVAAHDGFDDHAREVLGHVVDGLTDREIAERTGAPVDATTAEVAALVRRLTEPVPPVS